MQYAIFDLERNKSSKWYIFKNSTALGKIFETILWAELTKLLPEKKSPKGVYFDKVIGS